MTSSVRLVSSSVGFMALTGESAPPAVYLPQPVNSN